jgi:hypothetical protein
VPKLRVVSAAPGPLATGQLAFALPDDMRSGDLQGRLLAKDKF